MDYNLDKIRGKLFEAIDPENNYTIEQFNEEFGNVSHTLEVGNEGFNKLDVKIINKSNNEPPKYESKGAAGFDFRASLHEGEVIILGPSGSGNNIAMIPTGLHFELPNTLELQVRPRSGLAAKKGVTVLNSPGTVDSDYRGEVKVILINHSSEEFIINNGDRIAQGVISSVVSDDFIKFNIVNELSETERGEGGFGSTGIK
jgi:dUTP pyrophosphatase